jgi:UDP-N-acetylmuramoyl-L-alanyl-D-glutamate--2,6-diaminopimelate ligase
MEILKEMTSGISLSEPSAVISDRAAAIAYAVSLSLPGDTLLILGKGHEVGQEVSGQTIDFDDRVVLASAIEAQT